MAVCVKEFPDFLTVSQDFWDEAFGKDGDPVQVALALANGDLAAFDVDVFDAQLHQFFETKAAAVLDFGDEAVAGTESRKDGENLLEVQHDRDPLGGVASFHFQVNFLMATDFAEEENEGIEGLFLGAEAMFFYGDEVGQEIPRLFVF